MGDRHNDRSCAIMLSVDIAGKIDMARRFQSLAVPPRAIGLGSKMVAMCSRFVPFSASPGELLLGQIPERSERSRAWFHAQKTASQAPHALGRHGDDRMVTGR
jgi:hypothetical protein